MYNYFLLNYINFHIKIPLLYHLNDKILTYCHIHTDHIDFNTNEILYLVVDVGQLEHNPVAVL